MSEAIDFQPNFQPYLNAIRNEYGRWWEYYTVTDAQGRERRKAPERQGQREASPFDFGLMVQTVARDNTRRTLTPDNPEEPPKEPKEKIERLPVLDGLRKYAFDEKTRHLLLVGRPGSGKSTALARLLLEEVDRFLTGTSNTIPVLVELRYWRTSIEDLMLDAFRRHGLDLSASELDRLLNENRLLVLIDGMNELPTEEGRSQLVAFRRRYPRVPAIFTTRDLSLGGDAGIEKKLEMQPLIEKQMREFVEAYLPEDGEAMWRQLQGRLREFGETPLLLWMLCEVVKQSPNAELPTNLAGIFQVFTRSYEDSSVRKHQVAALKGDVRPLSDRRLWCKALKHLAWVMMHAKQFIPQLVIHRSEAERALEALCQKEPYPPKIARDCLDDLLKYHLLQIRTGDEIEFRHQLIQEYYAAEALRERLRDLNDAELKRDYLNYLKWTEPVALMLALVEDEALRVMRLALEVDWMLGARLAGEVKPEFQEQTVEMVSGLDVPQWLQFELWGKTRSDFAVPGLVAAFEHKSFHVRVRAAEVLGKLGSQKAISALLEHPDFYVRVRAVEALGTQFSQKAISALLQALEDRDAHVRGHALEKLAKLSPQKSIPALLRALESGDSHVCLIAAETLGNLGLASTIPNLLQALEHRHPYVRVRAAEALGKLGSQKAIPALLQALEYKDPDVRGRAAEALGKLGSQQAIIIGLFRALTHENFEVRWSAVEAFRERGSHKAIPALLQALEYRSPYVYGQATAALRNLDLDTVIPGLLRALTHENFEVRWSAVIALGELGSHKAIPALLQALEDEYSWVQKAAVETLGKLDSDAVIPGLLQTLEHENYEVRGRAAEVLGKLNSDAVIPCLRQLLEDENYEVRRSAVKALGNLGSEAAISILLQVLEDREYELLETAAEALGNLGSAAAIPILLQIFENEDDPEYVDYEKHQRAAKALGNIKDDRAAHILPHLLTLIPTWSGIEAFRALTAIQANCKFYNYDVFRSPPIRKPEAENPSAQTTYNIDRVGNLNTGDVTVHGNQIGTQNNTEPNTRSNLQ